MSDSTPSSGQRRLGENQCNSNFRSSRVDERSTSGIQQALHPSSSQNQNPEEINQDQIEKAENREVEDEDERKANMIDLFQENPFNQVNFEIGQTYPANELIINGSDHLADIVRKTNNLAQLTLSGKSIGFATRELTNKRGDLLTPDQLASRSFDSLEAYQYRHWKSGTRLPTFRFGRINCNAVLASQNYSLEILHFKIAALCDLYEVEEDVEVTSFDVLRFEQKYSALMPLLNAQARVVKTRESDRLDPEFQEERKVAEYSACIQAYNNVKSQLDQVMTHAFSLQSTVLENLRVLEDRANAMYPNPPIGLGLLRIDHDPRIVRARSSQTRRSQQRSDPPQSDAAANFTENGHGQDQAAQRPIQSRVDQSQQLPSQRSRRIGFSASQDSNLNSGSQSSQSHFQSRTVSLGEGIQEHQLGPSDRNQSFAQSSGGRASSSQHQRHEIDTQSQPKAGPPGPSLSIDQATISSSPFQLVSGSRAFSRSDSSAVTSSSQDLRRVITDPAQRALRTSSPGLQNETQTSLPAERGNPMYPRDERSSSQAPEAGNDIGAREQEEPERDEEIGEGGNQFCGMEEVHLGDQEQDTEDQPLREAAEDDDESVHKKTVQHKESLGDQDSSITLDCQTQRSSGKAKESLQERSAVSPPINSSQTQAEEDPRSSQFKASSYSQPQPFRGERDHEIMKEFGPGFSKSSLGGNIEEGREMKSPSTRAASQQLRAPITPTSNKSLPSYVRVGSSGSRSFDPSNSIKNRFASGSSTTGFAPTPSTSIPTRRKAPDTPPDTSNDPDPEEESQIVRGRGSKRIRTVTYSHNPSEEVEMDERDQNGAGEYLDFINDEEEGEGEAERAATV